jgi:fermentation-respiration switch protein FrsA (DUF1100 family)
MRTIKLFIAAVLLIHLSACETLVNSFSFFPNNDYLPESNEIPSYITPMILDTDDGIELESLLFTHNKRSAKFVIYFHGNAGNLYNRIEEASVIYNMGYDLVISGYRGYGKSSGEPSEKGIYIDARTVLNYAINTLNYSPEKIYIYGRSLGTAVAVDVSQNIGLGGVILITPFTSSDDLIKEKSIGLFSCFGSGYFLSIDKINNLKSPVLIIHGTKDEVVPYTLGVKLYDACSGIKKFITIDGGGHNNLEFASPDIYWSGVKEFLDK